METKTSKGITLIALVITIVVLLILSGVTLGALSGENGIQKRATEAKQKTEEFEKEEQNMMQEVEFFTKNAKEVVTWDENKKVNAPQLSTGMTKIMFIDPTTSSKGKVRKEGQTGFDENNWYSYESKKWANVQTEDGSMWVWIPRFAYKITYTDTNDKSKGGTIDVKFLIGTTDYYYEGVKIKKAQRQDKILEESDDQIDTTADYTVHPAFTNETKINYANGGWDKEISGIWVAKFEAGYASGNNDVTAEESSVEYSSSDAYVAGVELGGSATTAGARNWLDGVYGTTKTKIKYPVFQGLTYSMNYITINDAFNISRALTESENIYGLSKRTNSHLMKNSEWGACSYLGESQYGLGSTDITVNNISLNSGSAARTSNNGKTGVESVYTVTGVTSNSTSNSTNTISQANATTFGANMKNATGNEAVSGAYAWNQESGITASTTGTIYGVYDMSGGVWERTASYIPNSTTNLETYGKSVAYDANGTKRTTSTKYTMMYPYGTETSGDYPTSCAANYAKNTKIYGDGVRETSNSGYSNTGSWNSNFSFYPVLDHQFFKRGGYWGSHSYAGLSAFSDASGDSHYYYGFRSVLVVV